jgi:hypothetical protein
MECGKSMRAKNKIEALTASILKTEAIITGLRK